jgi:hypothetical protein
MSIEHAFLWGTLLAMLLVVAISYLRGTEKGNDTLFEGAIALSGTFLGVFLALATSSAHEERQVLQRVRQLVETSRQELSVSLSSLTETTTSPATILGAGPNRVLDQPSPALGVLLQSREFIERAVPEIVIDLNKINTAFPWISRSHGGITVTGDERGNREVQIQRIRTAIKLLEIQQSVFKGAIDQAEALKQRQDVLSRVRR